MTLPPWNPATQAERDAFAAFVIEELARLNERASDDGQAGEEYLEHVQAAHRLARVGFRLQVRTRAGRKPKPFEQWTNLDFAKRDVERMPAIFCKHWGHRNRHSRPTREDIAAEFWELTSAEKEELQKAFAKR
jgi:hypothetical protein